MAFENSTHRYVWINTTNTDYNEYIINKPDATCVTSRDYVFPQCLPDFAPHWYLGSVIPGVNKWKITTSYGANITTVTQDQNGENYAFPVSKSSYYGNGVWVNVNMANVLTTVDESKFTIPTICMNN